jgi:beta-N-acetylhexosaminidase
LSALPVEPLQLNAEDRDWVRRTQDSLSIVDQIAQLFVLSTREDTFAEIDSLLALKPGGIHRFPTASLENCRRATLRAIEMSQVTPLLSGDSEGGIVSYPFATPIPNQMGIAACHDLELARALAEVMAKESRALAFNWSFTPVVDINRAFRNAVVGTRSYGADVDAIIEHARIYVRTLQAHGIAASAKHWPGDGVDDRDQHLTTTVNAMDFATWSETFGRIYQALIDDGIMTIMSAHVALPDFVRRAIPNAGRRAYEPASVSRLLNEELLRGRLGFRGLIVSDATLMGGLTSWLEREEAVPAVIENGCDVFLFSRNPAEDMGLMLKGLRSGKLSERRLNEALTRVLSLKAALGLHRRTSNEQLQPLESIQAQLCTPAHRAVAKEAAGRGLTLVKDTQGLLPLDAERHRRVVVIADEGWSFFSGAMERGYGPLRDELRQRGFELRNFDPDALPTRSDADLILYLMGQEATPSLGNIHMDFAKLHGGSRKALAQFNREIPTLLISFGQPYYLYDAPNFSTYVNAYCPLEDSQRELARRLSGELGFTGKSPVDPFCGLDQLRW